MTAAELKQWRADMQMTQRAAADALGIAPVSYQELERGAAFGDGKPRSIDRRTELACEYLMMLKNNKG